MGTFLRQAHLDFGIWNLEFGAWYLPAVGRFGAWCPVLAIYIHS